MDLVKRLSFANGYLGFDWNKAIFSDEACFWTGEKGRVWVRRPKGKHVAYRREYCANKEHKGEKVNVMGFFTAHGVGEILIFDENMTGLVQRRLLKQGLLPTARKYYPSGMWWHLHDNDKKFHSKVVTEWCHEHGVNNMEFPAYSPDLNPIENLWAILKARVENRNPRDVEELKEVILAEWKSIEKDICARLAGSMIRRCQAVIDNEGGRTKY